jgi:hypothetical protein
VGLEKMEEFLIDISLALPIRPYHGESKAKSNILIMRVSADETPPTESVNYNDMGQIISKILTTVAW